MKVFMIIFFLASANFAEPVLEFWPKESSWCEAYGQMTNCPKDTFLQFSDDGSCACLKDEQFTHPRKCMIGPMFCDINLGQRYSWLHRYQIVEGKVEKIMSGCACAVNKFPINLVRSIKMTDF
ncbi:MAG: hypothetical protein KC505_07375 [Myxococcales bacterium]|nr:hypothetical protein [Myxococcales bacterium]USN50460.1 MAG: hypothetical protein H6731_09390 [Myxococcales bacterium]